MAVSVLCGAVLLFLIGVLELIVGKLKSGLLGCPVSLICCSLILASSFSFSYFSLLSLIALIISTTSVSTASRILFLSLEFSIFCTLWCDFWHWEVSSVVDYSQFFFYCE